MNFNEYEKVIILRNSNSPMRLTFAWAQVINLLLASMIMGVLTWALGVRKHFPAWLSRLPKVAQIFFSLLFGILIEEVHLANKFRVISIKMIQVKEKTAEYDELTTDEKEVVEEYFRIKKEFEKKSMKVLQVESSVQLVFYLVKLLFELVDPPVMEMNYGPMRENEASARWVLLILYLLVKTIMSGFSTFKPILASVKSDSYNRRRESPTLPAFAFVILKMLADVLFATLVVFLVR